MLLVLGLAALATALAFGSGWLALRTELRSMGGVAMTSPRVVLATLQAMIGGFTTVVGVGSGLLSVGDTYGTEQLDSDKSVWFERWDKLESVTVAGALGWLPFALVLAAIAVRYLYVGRESKELPLPLLSIAIYFVALMVIWSHPALLGG